VYDPRYPFDDATYNPIVTGTATRKAVDTTLSAAAGVSQSNPRNVPCVPPGALALGDYVILENQSTQRERGRVRAIAAASIELEEDLQFDYASGDSLVSAEMTSPAIPDVFLQNEDNLGENYYARWSYTVDSVAHAATTRWDLVREPFRSGVRDSDLLKRYPDLLHVTRFQNHPATLAPIIEAAERDVQMILGFSGYDPDKVRPGDEVDNLVIFRTFALLGINGAHPPDRDAELYRDDVVKEWEYVRQQLVDGQLKIPYDINEDDQMSDAEEAGAATYTLTR